MIGLVEQYKLDMTRFVATYKVRMKAPAVDYLTEARFGQEPTEEEAEFMQTGLENAISWQRLKIRLLLIAILAACFFL